MRYYDRISVFGTAEQKVEQIVEYLYSLTDILNHNLEGSTPEAVWNATNEALKGNVATAEGTDKTTEEQRAKDGYAALRNLVLKSATNILKIEDSFSYTYTGGFFAESEDGTFSEDGYLNINGTPYNIAQVYKYQSEAISGVADYKRELEGYIKTGILDKEADPIVFGMDIGYNRSAYYYNDTEYKVKTLSKLRLTPDRISFYIDDNEKAYISKDKIYFPGAVIEGGSLSCSDGSSSVEVSDGSVRCYMNNKKYGTISAIPYTVSAGDERKMMAIVSDYENSEGICIGASAKSVYIQYREERSVNIKIRHHFIGNVWLEDSMDIGGYIYSKGAFLIGVSESLNLTLGTKDRPGHTFIYSGTDKDVRLYGKNVYLYASQYVYVPAGVGMLFKTSSTAEYARGIYCGTVGNLIGMHVGIGGEALFLHGDVMLGTGAAVSSDRRRKKDITALNDRYESFFEKLKPKSFRYIMNSGKEHIGFIAQEVAEALETSGINKEEAGSFVRVNNTQTEEFALVYEEFIALNTFMIKKCLKRIEELEKIIKEKVVV
ncbi:MAG: tail fiber domain-containing protein [Clostridia bacterium]|nr:tail fiber domain-containing protein [Clostridia bacterium]